MNINIESGIEVGKQEQKLKLEDHDGNLVGIYQRE